MMIVSYVQSCHVSYVYSTSGMCMAAKAMLAACARLAHMEANCAGRNQAHHVTAHTAVQHLAQLHQLLERRSSQPLTDGIAPACKEPPQQREAALQTAHLHSLSDVCYDVLHCWF
jgi:hypothetical protein